MTDKTKLGLLIAGIFAGSAAVAGIVYVVTEEKSNESKKTKENKNTVESPRVLSGAGSQETEGMDDVEEETEENEEDSEDGASISTGQEESREPEPKENKGWDWSALNPSNWSLPW